MKKLEIVSFQALVPDENNVWFDMSSNSPDQGQSNWHQYFIVILFKICLSELKISVDQQ